MGFDLSCYLCRSPSFPGTTFLVFCVAFEGEDGGTKTLCWHGHSEQHCLGTPSGTTQRECCLLWIVSEKVVLAWAKLERGWDVSMRGGSISDGEGGRWMAVSALASSSKRGPQCL